MLYLLLFVQVEASSKTDSLFLASTQKNKETPYTWGRHQPARADACAPSHQTVSESTKGAGMRKNVEEELRLEKH